jgi:hypothetical protein
MEHFSKTQLLQLILELDDGIDKIESIIKNNHSVGVFTLNWATFGAIPLILGKEVVESYNIEKVKFAKNFLKMIKARKSVLENELKKYL